MIEVRRVGYMVGGLAMFVLFNAICQNVVVADWFCIFQHIRALNTHKAPKLWSAQRPAEPTITNIRLSEEQIFETMLAAYWKDNGTVNHSITPALNILLHNWSSLSKRFLQMLTLEESQKSRPKMISN